MRQKLSTPTTAYKAMGGGEVEGETEQINVALTIRNTLQYSMRFSADITK